MKYVKHVKHVRKQLRGGKIPQARVPWRERTGKARRTGTAFGGLGSNRAAAESFGPA
ncbi:hypothetical protein YDYSY3_50270 [Paenibacillus chitinolyticus]|uniref:hypothetical protein n=1 Tax=Paenibacillus chitinolyticus TaxID=79263 RepID=UPI0026E4F215|nr:hypothetical protein [Paenibacillus chitinolyticus]GKS14027.1 hypothetical protein YDYSY3_50270 [Paenibacillus chitinolyticus]